MLGDYEAEINVYFFRYEKVFVTDQTEGLNTRKSVDPKDEDEGRPKITKGPKFLKPTSVEKPRVEEEATECRQAEPLLEHKRRWNARRT